MSLLERIKLKCTEKGLSIRTLEELAGFSYATIGKWEKQKPSYDKVLTVANCLQVSIEWLITGNEPGTLSPEEQHLVDLYRAADQRGKRSIMRSAEAENQELESSTSKLG